MSDESSLIQQLLLIFFSTALVAVIVLYLRQAITIAYIAAGFLFGPSGLGYITDASWVEDLSSVGIVYLLFLLGLSLRPQKAISMLGEALFVTLTSTIFFSVLITFIAHFLGYNVPESLTIGVATAFSSTIIGLKLLPTTTLHHKRRGEMIISVLLLQDFIAIALLLIYANSSNESDLIARTAFVLVVLPLLITVVFLVERFVVNFLISRFDEIHEFIFLLAIGWCSLCALVFHHFGFSYEAGGFVSGVALASSPASQFFAERLKPIRDFFLVLFFFSLGASFGPHILKETIFTALLLSLIIVVGKPYLFGLLFKIKGESKRQAREVGIRLGQAGEFGILLAVTALGRKVVSYEVCYLIQLTIVLTLVFSSFYITSRYPTPISVKKGFRKD